MKYEANRYFLYPVARRFFNDYPESEIRAKCKAEQAFDRVQITLTYQVDDISISRQIRDSSARCVAMLYCADTLYRQSIQASPDSPFKIVTSVPMILLRNRVQVHPVIVAQKDIQLLPLGNVHKEYAGMSFNIKAGQPLAIASRWSFNVDPIQMQSIFNLNIDNKYKPDEFEVLIDPTEKYIDIIANDNTMSWFHKIRRDKKVVLPSIYISSLITVLSEFKEYNKEVEDILNGYPSDGWFWSIRRKMDEIGITLSDDSDKEKCSLMMAAQRLLTGHGYPPFRHLLEQQGVDSND